MLLLPRRNLQKCLNWNVETLPGCAPLLRLTSFELISSSCQTFSLFLASCNHLLWTVNFSCLALGTSHNCRIHALQSNENSWGGRGYRRGYMQVCATPFPCDDIFPFLQNNSYYPFSPYLFSFFPLMFLIVSLLSSPFSNFFP